MTPLEVLHTEREYPGFIEYVALEMWQKHLIKEQLAGQTSGNDGPE